MKFATKKCPLCSENLVPARGSGLQFIQCPKYFTPHYQIEFKDKLIIQHIVAQPYLIENIATYNEKDKKYEIKAHIYDAIKLQKEGISKAFITETSQFRPDEPEKMVTRIKNLLAFI